MRKFGKLFIFILVTGPFIFGEDAHGQWKKVKKFIQKDVEVIKHTKKVLILKHNATQDTIVVSMSKRDDSDIYGKFEQRRGGNPYRVWVASEKFWEARDKWMKFLRPGFLMNIRPPKNT